MTGPQQTLEFADGVAGQSFAAAPCYASLPPVLDACCSSRMMWLDKTDDRTLFMDRRNEDYWLKPSAAYKNGKMLKVRPDVVADFTAMPFPDESFWHVVFDPPHIIRKAELGDVTKAYGCLNGDWESMLAAGFRECFRVLKPNGTLIFKWCEVAIPLERIMALTPEKPLYGHRSGAKAQTHWVAFLKHNDQAERQEERRQ